MKDGMSKMINLEENLEENEVPELPAETRNKEVDEAEVVLTEHQVVQPDPVLYSP